MYHKITLRLQVNISKYIFNSLTSDLTCKTDQKSSRLQEGRDSITHMRDKELFTQKFRLGQPFPDDDVGRSLWQILLILE